MKKICILGAMLSILSMSQLSHAEMTNTDYNVEKAKLYQKSVEEEKSLTGKDKLVDIISNYKYYLQGFEISREKDKLMTSLEDIIGEDAERMIMNNEIKVEEACEVISNEKELKIHIDECH